MGTDTLVSCMEMRIVCVVVMSDLLCVCVCVPVGMGSTLIVSLSVSNLCVFIGSCMRVYVKECWYVTFSDIGTSMFKIVSKLRFLQIWIHPK